MSTISKETLALYVDHHSQQWIARDADGNFWALLPIENAWEHRVSFEVLEETDLEPIPGHYKYLLDLPW
jgi:hypothetical protein